MKLKLIEDKSLKEAMIDISYSVFDRRIKKVIDLIEKQTIQLEGQYDNNVYIIDSQDVFYLESVDNLCFIYTDTQVLESKEKLYALETKFRQTSFVRINKSTILNMDYLKSVSPLSNYRLEAHLENGEKLIISRHYMKDVKQYLTI